MTLQMLIIISTFDFAGVFIIADKTTGWIVAIIAASLSGIATVLWLRMIAKNVKMGTDSAKKLMDSFREHLKKST